MDQQKIRDSVMPDMNAGCWLWLGAINSNKYGLIYDPKLPRGPERTFRAHRVSYECFVGPIPTGMAICHKCDNPICVNPDHLFAGTRADNMKDMMLKGRSRRPTKRNALSNAQVLEVKALLKAGCKGTEIARMFNTTPEAVYLVKYGLKGKHLQIA